MQACEKITCGSLNVVVENPSTLHTSHPSVTLISRHPVQKSHPPLKLTTTRHNSQELETVLFVDMAIYVEDDSETATEAGKRVPPLDSDKSTGDNKSSPYSSPPPVNKNFSFKPFIMSRAQKRAIAEKANRETSIAIAKTTSESEDRRTDGADRPKDRTDETRSDAISHSMELKSLIDAAKQQALAKKKPKKADRVEELYQQSLNDKRLTVLLETALRTNATPEQQQELQRYIDGTKTTTGISRDTTPKDAMSIPMSTNMSETESQPSIVPMENMTTTATPPEEPITPETLTTFCATQLWPRYCRLPPGPNTSVEFKAITSSTINDRGQSVPKHPAPLVWLEEVVTELSYLLEVARVDESAWIQMLMTKPGYGGQDVHVLLAEEVRWATHHGPSRKREERMEIGVLLECVGIESKGSFWYPIKTQ